MKVHIFSLSFSKYIFTKSTSLSFSSTSWFTSKYIFTVSTSLSFSKYHKIMNHVEYQNSKITVDSCWLDTKHLYSDWYDFMAVRRKHEKRGRPCKGFQLISFAATHTPVSSVRWPKTNFSLWISKLNSPIFKFSHFYIWFILITYCIILSGIITCARNPYFSTPVDKPWFVHYPYHVFSNGFLTWVVKPSRHLCTRLTFERNYNYIQSPLLTYNLTKSIKWFI